VQATVFFDLDETPLRSVPWSQFGPVRPTRRTDSVITVDNYTYTVATRPGVYRILSDIEHAGHKLFIFTAADPVYANAALKAIGLRDCFDFIFSTQERCAGGELLVYPLRRSSDDSPATGGVAFDLLLSLLPSFRSVQ